MLKDLFEHRYLKRKLNQINRLAPRMRAMSDQELQAQTAKLKRRLHDGQLLNKSYLRLMPQLGKLIIEFWVCFHMMSR